MLELRDGITGVCWGLCPLSLLVHMLSEDYISDPCWSTLVQMIFEYYIPDRCSSICSPRNISPINDGAYVLWEICTCSPLIYMFSVAIMTRSVEWQTHRVWNLKNNNKIWPYIYFVYLDGKTFLDTCVRIHATPGQMTSRLPLIIYIVISPIETLK